MKHLGRRAFLVVFLGEIQVHFLPLSQTHSAKPLIVGYMAKQVTVESCKLIDMGTCSAPTSHWLRSSSAGGCSPEPPECNANKRFWT